MAKIIPEYFAQEEAETARLPRAPVRRLADTGQGLEARAIEGLGRDIEATSGYLALINEIEGNSQFDTARRKVRESYNDFLFGLEDNKDPATYPKAYKKFLKEAGKLAPVNQVGNQKYQQWLQLQTPGWDTKVEWARRDMVKLNAQDAYITNLMGLSNIKDRKSAKAEARTLTAGAVGDKLITPRQGAADYQRIMSVWDEKDRVELIEGIYDDVKAMPYEEAVGYINDMKGLSSAERNDLITRRKRDQVILEEEQKKLQMETTRDMLLDLWDNKLELKTIGNNLEAGIITIEQAKSLRESLTKPKTFDLAAYIKTMNAVNDYKRGAIDFDFAQDVLIENAKLLGDSGKGIATGLYAEIDKNEAGWEKEGLDYIENQILDKDLLTGILYGTPVQQTRAMEARLAYDIALEQAERKGEPILGRDKLFLAHDIMLKYRPTAAEKAKREPPARLRGELGYINYSEIDKAIEQAKKNLGDKATSEDIKREVKRLLGE